MPARELYRRELQDLHDQALILGSIALAFFLGIIAKYWLLR